jgi:hypothetical protein
VSIDVLPPFTKTPVNPGRAGAIRVAVLSPVGCDATRIEGSTVRLGATGQEAAPVPMRVQDVDADGHVDLLCHVNSQDTGLSCGMTTATLTAMTVEDLAIRGADAIRTVNCH